MPETRTPHAVPTSVTVLVVLNALLFAFGAIVHIGVPLAGWREPVVVPAMMLESVATILLGLATTGFFLRATWSRKLATFANIFAVVAVVAITMLLGLDGQRSTTGIKAIQFLRVAVAVGCFLLLHAHASPRDQA